VNRRFSSVTHSTEAIHAPPASVALPPPKLRKRIGALAAPERRTRSCASAKTCPPRKETTSPGRSRARLTPATVRHARAAERPDALSSPLRST
jgi:hypothetical protein